jgi:hypothetical protein
VNGTLLALAHRLPAGAQIGAMYAHPWGGLGHLVISSIEEAVRPRDRVRSVAMLSGATAAIQYHTTHADSGELLAAPGSSDLKPVQ